MTVSTLTELYKALEAARGEVARIETAIAAAPKFDPKVGDQVSFIFGRGEKKRQYVGQIVGQRDGVSAVFVEEELQSFKIKTTDLEPVSEEQPEQVADPLAGAQTVETQESTGQDTADSASPSEPPFVPDAKPEADPLAALSQSAQASQPKSTPVAQPSKAPEGTSQDQVDPWPISPLS